MKRKNDGFIASTPQGVLSRSLEIKGVNIRKRLKTRWQECSYQDLVL